MLFDIRCHWLRSGEEDEELDDDEEPELLQALVLPGVLLAGAVLDHWARVFGVDAACGSGFREDGAVRSNCCWLP